MTEPTQQLAVWPDLVIAHVPQPHFGLVGAYQASRLQLPPAAFHASNYRILSMERWPAARLGHSRRQIDTSQQGVSEILEVIRLLAAAEIPSCVVGVKALRCYGAARITNTPRYED
ncbi:hypothetical protein B0T18DRAFT_487456 [Schizothecium vesticola]|uniref:Uncharacterized protein n=1 Tax=Schizothecium vesticola TaxID=314040 RepID=A0AA40K8R7_9PEZI|nr:hypothetical protein B0T18DRAFT_487456 [Schizothecium vesticola]